MQQEIEEQRFMGALCKSVTSFQIERALGSGQYGAVLEVRCVEAGHRWSNNRYAMKVCFNFELNTTQAQSAYLNEYAELVKLPSHHNIIRFLCEFFGEVDDSIRPHLPEFARESSIVRPQDGTPRNRKTQFFVVELADETLESFIRRAYPPPSVIPTRLVRMIVAQVGSALLHLERQRVAHRDIKLDNILVNLNSAHRPSDERSLPITRCMIGDFGTACELDEGLKLTISVTNTGRVVSGSMWGNEAHIAPELHSALNAAKASGRAMQVELDFSKQAVYELGIVGYEVVTGEGPLNGEYPSSLVARGSRGASSRIEYGDDQITLIREERLEREQASMLKRMVACDPSRRPSLVEVLKCFDEAQEFHNRVEIEI